jgi:glutathione synthase/RimK-type ligase-like ATP-grasp enzyme
MPRCAFLTMENLHSYVSDDALAYAPLRTLGWHVEAVPWRRPVADWSSFDAVIIRSTWDYQHAPQAFLSVLGQIQRSGAHLENALDLVKWNVNKTYLGDLERRGVPIVPTVWGSDIGPVDEHAILRRLGTDEVVLKPVIGASADHAYRLTSGSAGWSEAAAAFEQRQYLAQPFLRQIVDEGEYSLFFFGGELSHTVLKTPKIPDFRVQEEYGGVIRAVSASRGLVSAAERVIVAIGKVPLYARVDLVRLEEGVYGLMELELIEPSLYFRMDANAPERFAQALHSRIRSRLDY